MIDFTRNILQSLPQLDPAALQTLTSSGMPQSNVMQQAAPAEAPRPRRSFLDTVGRISDVLARVGGADALYQPTLDANAARTQQVDLAAMEKQLNQQKLAAGGDEATARNVALMGGFGRGLKAIQAGGGDIMTALPILAQRIGLPPERIASLAQEVAENPQIIDSYIDMADKNQQQGSLPSSIQNYAMYQKLLAEQGQEAADQFMRFAQPEMEAIRPYQQAQLSMDEREFRRQLLKDRREANATERELVLKETKGSAGADLTPTQRGTVTLKLKMLPVVKQQLKNVTDLQAQMQEGGTFARGSLGGLLPGAVAGGTAERFDKALGALRKSILSLTRTPGIGSMSNYETALDEMQLPSRWGSDAGRAEAIKGITELIQGLESGYREMVPTTSATKSSKPLQRIIPRQQRGGRNPNGGWSIVGVK